MFTFVTGNLLTGRLNKRFNPGSTPLPLGGIRP